MTTNSSVGGLPRAAVEAAAKASYERGNSEPWAEAEASIKDEFYADAIVMLNAASKAGFGHLPHDSLLSRVEVIDGVGRAFIKYTPPGSVTLARQDDGRTLKVFIAEYEKSTRATAARALRAAVDEFEHSVGVTEFVEQSRRSSPGGWVNADVAWGHQGPFMDWLRNRADQLESEGL